MTKTKFERVTLDRAAIGALTNADAERLDGVQVTITWGSSRYMALGHAPMRDSGTLSAIECESGLVLTLMTVDGEYTVTSWGHPWGSIQTLSYTKEGTA